jgi:hypothetical protein
VLEACATARHGVISVENHGVTGGLGTALAERLAEVGCTARLVTEPATGRARGPARSARTASNGPPASVAP